MSFSIYAGTNLFIWLAVLSGEIAEIALSARLLALHMIGELPIGSLTLSIWTAFWSLYSIYDSWQVASFNGHRRRLSSQMAFYIKTFTLGGWLVYAGILTGDKSISKCRHASKSHCTLLIPHLALAWLIPILFSLTIFWPLEIMTMVTIRSFFDEILARFRRSAARQRAALRLWANRGARHLRQSMLELQDALPGSFRCSICQEDRRTALSARFAPCRHPFCLSCAREYVRSKLGERRFPVLCPLCMTEPERGSGTIGSLDERLIARIRLSDSESAMLTELELAKFSVLIECSACERSTYIDKQEYHSAKTITCPLPGCPRTWCKTCWWTTDAQDVESRWHTCEGVPELNLLMTEQGWKYCPGCKTPTERTSGCDHMTCGTPGCDTHFCYPCGDAVPSSGFAVHNARCRAQRH